MAVSVPSFDAATWALIGVIVGAVLSKVLDGLGYLLGRRYRLAEERTTKDRVLLTDAQASLEQLRLFGGASLNIPTLATKFRVATSGPLADESIRAAFSALVRLETLTEAVRDEAIRAALNQVTAGARLAFDAEGTQTAPSQWKATVEAMNKARALIGESLRQD